MNRIIDVEGLEKLLKEIDKKIVFTNGCFDILHIGHVRYLQEAKDQGDVLIVGLNSDDSIRKLKGESRPLVKQEERAEILAALRCVDYVIVFNEETVEILLDIIKPDVYVKGGDYNLDTINQAERKIVEKYGGKIYFAEKVGGKSTTSLISKIYGPMV